MMYVVYVHAGAVTKLNIPSEGLESLVVHGQCIDGAHVSYFILHGNSINFVNKYL